MSPLDRAEKARRILEDQVFAQAWTDMRESLVRRLEVCQAQDVETQHEIAVSLQLLKQVRGQLEKYISAGQFEKHKESSDNWARRLTKSLSP